MTLGEALEIVVARTRHERYRWLCSDENPEADQREGCRQYVLRMAGDPQPEPSPLMVPLASSIRAMRLGFRQCLYSSHEGCGCTGTRCYRHGRVVSLRECVECLEGN